MRPQRLIVIQIVGCLMASFASGAEAQGVASSFDELRGILKPGKTIKVTVDTGQKVQGKVAGLSTASLTLRAPEGEQEFQEVRVVQITERRRNTGRGALIGFLSGVGFVVLSAVTSDECPEGCAPMDSPVVIGGVAGILGA